MIEQELELIIKTNNDTVKVKMKIISVDFNQLDQEKIYIENYYQIKYPNSTMTWKQI